MAYDSVTIIVLSKPIVSFTVNDWNLNAILPSPTLASNMNDWKVNTIIPYATVTFTMDVANSWNLTKTLQSPYINATIEPDGVFEVNKIIQLPKVTFTVDNPNVYSFINSVKQPKVIFTVGINNTYVVQKILPKPTLDCITNLFQTTGSIDATNKQTWCFNTITTAHSRYDNYDFDSFFRIGQTNYGLIKGKGIYKLAGNADFIGELNETPIDASVDMPISAFGEQTMKACSDAIIYGRCDGDIEVQCVMDEQEERDGFIVSFDERPGMHRKRVKIPKGLKGNTWQFKLRNVDGSNFNLNAFEVFLKTLQRIKW